MMEREMVMSNSNIVAAEFVFNMISLKGRRWLSTSCRRAPLSWATMARKFNLTATQNNAVKSFVCKVLPDF